MVPLKTVENAALLPSRTNVQRIQSNQFNDQNNYSGKGITENLLWTVKQLIEKNY